jgi:hypothetical protein
VGISVRALHLIAVVVALPFEALAAQVSVIQLKSPQLKHDSTFSGVTSARILTDDRVLIAEFDARRLVMLDFGAQSVRQVGRRGQGPGEYSTTPVLFPLGGDSTLATVRTQRRWLVLSSDTIVATVPPTDSNLIKTRASIISANKAQLLFTRDRPPRTDGTVDSADVFLLDRTSGRVDPIARIRIAPVRVQGSKDSQGRTIETSEVIGVIRTSESVVLASDGWVAIVRLDPPRTDWRQPNGEWVRGTVLSIPQVQLDDKQKAWYLRENPPSSARSAASLIWPSVMPLFRGNVFPSADGRVIASRSRDADTQYPRYLVLNRRGLVEGEIRLQPRQRILDVSSKWILIVSTDNDGLQQLSLHAWP